MIRCHFSDSGPSKSLRLCGYNGVLITDRTGLCSYANVYYKGTLDPLWFFLDLSYGDMMSKVKSHLNKYKDCPEIVKDLMCILLGKVE